MFQTLSPGQAFSAGADLWILPFAPQSLLFRKINWRMGFLLHPLSSGGRPLPSVHRPRGRLDSHPPARAAAGPASPASPPEAFSPPSPAKAGFLRGAEIQAGKGRPAGRQLSFGFEGRQARRSFSALLFPSGGAFPCKWLLCLKPEEEGGLPQGPWTGAQAACWAAACYRSWIRLSKPSLRIFLPRGLGFDSMQKEWPEDSAFAGQIACLTAS